MKPYYRRERCVRICGILESAAEVGWRNGAVDDVPENLLHLGPDNFGCVILSVWIVFRSGLKDIHGMRISVFVLPIPPPKDVQGGR